MENVIKRSKIAIAMLSFLVTLIACDSNGVYDKYITLENSLWEQNKSVDFEFTVTDTVSKNNLFINIRNNNDYEYSNLFLITHINFPNGKKIVDTLQYEMADKTGKFLGSGLSEIKESKLFFKENSIFPLSGDYKISIQQAMRKNGNPDGIEKLKGITDVGLRIEKAE